MKIQNNKWEQSEGYRKRFFQRALIDGAYAQDYLVLS